MKAMDRQIPKWAFDKEYGTDWPREVTWLKERGILPVFCKVNRYGVKRFKYTKTPELFAALECFYRERELARVEREFGEAARVDGHGELPNAHDFAAQVGEAIRKADELTAGDDTI